MRRRYSLDKTSKKRKRLNTMKYTHISADPKFHFNLKEILQYKDLIFLFTKRSFVLKYKQTILGPLWLFIKPLLTGLMHMFVFGNIANLGTDGTPKILFYFTGTALWSLFADCVTMNASIFTSNVNLFGKVYFPRLTMALSYLLSNLVRFGIQMVLTVVMMLFFIFQGALDINPWQLFLLLPLLLEIGIMGMGVGLIVSSITTKYRDLSVLVEFGMNLWMYITPVAYPLSQIADQRLKAIILANPVSAPVEAFRCCLFRNGTISLFSLLYSIIFTIAIAFCGTVLFNKVEKTFQDVV